MFQVNPMKNQALFSLKDKSKKFKSRLLQFLFGASRINYYLSAMHRMRDIGFTSGIGIIGGFVKLSGLAVL